MSSSKKTIPEIPLGVFLQGQPVTDEAIKGQHPLFYGTVGGLPGYQRDPHAYVKVLPADRLFAEVISASIGRHFGLPIPAAALVIARGSLIDRPGSNFIALASIDTAAVPIGRLMSFDSITQLLDKWVHRHAAAVFDELIANADRNQRNMLLGSDGKLWLIDHEEALSEPIAQAGARIRNRLMEMLSAGLSEIERHRAARALKSSAAPLYKAKFDLHATAGRPECCQASDEHVRQVVDFLEARVHHMGVLLDAGVGLKQRSMPV